MIVLNENNRMLGFELLSSCPNISHFVTTRWGGYSKGNYESFNCSPYTGDEKEHVKANQRLLCENLPESFKQLIIPRQIHGTEIRVIDSGFFLNLPDKQKELLNGVDALITNQVGACICISTADCVPVLFYDEKNNVVAAAHAGWRGTVERITASVLNTMHEKFGSRGEDILVGIGPSISLESFEVGDEVYQAFSEKKFPMNKISIRNKETQKYHIDLWEANRIQLLEFGIPETNIECAGICTYIHHNDFFSARRLGINSGRILSGIMIN